jgi:hypothetical protein
MKNTVGLDNSAKFDLANTKVRYIKLGAGGAWSDQCIATRTLRLGFWTGDPDIFSASILRNWSVVEKLLRERRQAGTNRLIKSVKNDLRQVREVFGDDGTTVWIMFHDRKMYWGLIDVNKPPETNLADRCSVFHMKVGWSAKSLRGHPLLVDKLPGHVSMVSQYKGTVCELRSPKTVLRRLSDLDSELFIKGNNCISALERVVVSMIRELDPNDFESLVDVLFRELGWHRIGKSGGTLEDIDFLFSRTTLYGEERVAVQVKSKVSQSVFNECCKRLLNTYPHVFFVFHTGAIFSTDKRVTLLDANALAPLVIDSGLTRWLLDICR